MRICTQTQCSPSLTRSSDPTRIRATTTARATGSVTASACSPKALALCLIKRHLPTFCHKTRRILHLLSPNASGPCFGSHKAPSPHILSQNASDPPPFISKSDKKNASSTFCLKKCRPFDLLSQSVCAFALQRREHATQPRGRLALQLSAHQVPARRHPRDRHV